MLGHRPRRIAKFDDSAACGLVEFPPFRRKNHVMPDTSLRYVEMLRLIPANPPGITAADMQKKLEAAGYAIHRRSIERDLIKLSQLHPIALNDKGRPAGWHWQKDHGFSAPGMDAAQAMELELAARYLKPLLPVNVWQTLAPRVNEARATLGMMSKAPLARWRTRVAFVDDGQPLLAPQVAPDVLAVVHECLLQGRRFTVEYLSLGKEEPGRFEVSPIALVYVGRTGYLVAGLWDYTDVRHLALHRMSAPKVLEKKASEPAGFDLQTYLRRDAAFDLPGESEVKLRLRVSDWLARHLGERPLSEQQRITSDKDETGLWIVQATVRESERLVWWLRSHGAAVEVMAPAALRRRMAAEVEMLAGLYTPGN